VPSLRAQLLHQSAGANSGAPQDLIGHQVSDPRDETLIHQRRLYSAAAPREQRDEVACA
jgi:hypothetical protein